ncbi:MAG: GGDEF domain-containing protein [Pseudomonadota bacterium]
MAADHTSIAETRVQRSCLDLIFGQSRTAWLSNAFCVILLWLAFWNNANHGWLLVWTGLIASLMAMRETITRRYLKLAGQPIELAPWTRWVEASQFANGCLWGVACAGLALIATPYQLPVILVIAGGLQTGSVLSSSYLLRAFALFSLPLFLLTLAAILVLGVREQPSLFVTAALLIVWSLFILLCAKRFGDHYRRSIETAHENHDLAESLRSINRENEQLNQSLNERIIELRDAQQHLLKEKERSDGLVKQLRQLSTTDPLTGLGNRRFFDDCLNGEWQRALRNAHPIALVLADIDNYKAFNDRYGHQRGDTCLVEVAAVLKTAARREGDWATRYGGEEFGLILANTTLDAATELAEKLRLALFELAIEHDTSPTAGVVTISCGVTAVVPDADTAPESLISAADKALYAAKQAGRNRVIAHYDWHTDQQRHAW